MKNDAEFLCETEQDHVERTGHRWFASTVGSATSECGTCRSTVIRTDAGPDVGAAAKGSDAIRIYPPDLSAFAEAIAADVAEEIREAIGRCRSPYDVHRIDFRGLVHDAIVRHTRRK